MKDIDKILERYFEGESTLEEEQILRNYFGQPEIEERHKIYAPIFQFFITESSENSESDTKETIGKRQRFNIRPWISIAASIAIIVGLYIIFSPQIENPNKSIVYINGNKTTDINIINDEALNSIDNVTDMDESIVESQIDILDLFTE